MLNQITLMGRLTRNPELRYTKTSTPVASFSLAVERDYADESGHRKADFIDCVAWRNVGEFICDYFGKGNMIAVTGRLQLRDWTDERGNKRRSAEVIVERAFFCESKTKAAKDDESSFAPAGDGVPVFAEVSDEDGELPF